MMFGHLFETLRNIRLSQYKRMQLIHTFPFWGFTIGNDYVTSFSIGTKVVMRHT